MTSDLGGVLVVFSVRIRVVCVSRRHPACAASPHMSMLGG
jgi:hypothetical protein